jgi:thiol:disulfide interchange protein DsbC
MQIKKALVAIGATLALSGLFQTAVADTAQIKARLEKIMPGVEPDSIAKAPVAGFHEVVFGPKVVYMSDDGRYLLQANIIDLESEENLTETRRSAAIKSSLDKVGEDNMVIFGDKDAKHTITVFTDIDCGYCRKLHSEIASYNKAGIRVRYLFFPRAGLGSPSYDKAVSVWCASDRKGALTEAKNGKEISAKQCDNPVATHMHLGELMGVNGTPALILPDGEMLPGYVPADRLGKYLEGRDQTAMK